MIPEELETDYFVIGAGAMGMAFADEILTQKPSARVTMVDRHARPGGHWNDAYSFVSLHQPAAYYGVNSESLGDGGAALASGIEVLAYYDRVLKKLTATGRLRYFPMCEANEDGGFHSLVERDRSCRVKVRKKIVDATYMNVQVPAIRPPQFEMAPGVTCVPPNALPGVRNARSTYVVIGSGKTGIDAVLFLLDQGVDPDHISWIMPNDAWLLDRAQIQPRHLSSDGLGRQLQHFASSDSLNEVMKAIEEDDAILRLDPNVWPTKYRCATVSREELTRLRTVQKVIRMGRVLRLDPSEIVLEGGRVHADDESLYIDCTANGLAHRDRRAVFDGNRITLQSMVMCQQVFSAAVIAYVECRFDDEKRKNELCQVVPHPELTRDFVLAMAITGQNMEAWGRAFGRWLRGSRLCMIHHDSLFSLLLSGLRARKWTAAATENIGRILAKEFPEKPPSGTSNDTRA